MDGTLLYKSLYCCIVLITEDQTEKEGDRPELPVPFDEEDFLQGKIPVLGGEAKPREPVGKQTTMPM